MFLFEGSKVFKGNWVVMHQPRNTNYRSRLGSKLILLCFLSFSWFRYAKKGSLLPNVTMVSWMQASNGNDKPSTTKSKYVGNLNHFFDLL